YAPFTPTNSELRLPPPYYRGCWHGVSRGFFYGYRQPCGFFPVERVLRPKGLHHPRGVAWSGLPPWPKIPHCCLPKKSRPCLSPSVSARPPRPHTDRCLREPFPDQLAHQPRAPPSAMSSPHHNVRSRLY